MKTSYFRSIAAVVTVLCVGLVSGCTPAVQSASVGSQKATHVLQNNVSWTSLQSAISKSDGATIYKVKSSVTLKDGSMHTNYSLYGAVNLPNTISVQVHENNFNISFYQQGQVAYSDELGTWMQSSPVSDIDAYSGYRQLIDSAIAAQTPLQQLNKTYVDNEYCDVYRATFKEGTLPLPSFLQSVTGGTTQTGTKDTIPASIQYTFYVGKKSGYVREIQTQDINTVNEIGPVATATDMTFFDINNAKLAQISVPQTLVKQLENKG